MAKKTKRNINIYETREWYANKINKQADELDEYDNYICKIANKYVNSIKCYTDDNLKNMTHKKFGYILVNENGDIFKPLTSPHLFLFIKKIDAERYKNSLAPNIKDNVKIKKIVL